MAKGEFLDKAHVWENPDGTLAVTYFLKSAMREGENESDFIGRSIQKIKDSRPEMAGLPGRVKNVSEIKALANTRTDRQKLKMKANGDLFVDSNHKTKEEKRQEKLNATKARLKGLNFTDEEIAVIVRGVGD